MTESIDESQKNIVAEFAGFTDWEDRYAHIIRLGKQHPDIPEEFKTETFRVKGCQSTVYLHARLEDGRVYYRASSDAMIVRGLIALLLRVYSGRTPEEILRTPPDFIHALGLTENLTMGRQNGLKAMIEQIKLYAMAFHAMSHSPSAN
jgi:cysteine desulfuration protein SufE